MLVLSRKLDESIIIDGDIRITVLSVRGNQVRLGIEVPNRVGVYREELLVVRRGRRDDRPAEVPHRECRGLIRRRAAPSGPRTEAVRRPPMNRHDRVEGAEYRFRHGTHELRLTVRDIDDQIAEAVARGAAEFALDDAEPGIILGYRFDKAVPWSSAEPFHWTLLPVEERVVPAAPGRSIPSRFAGHGRRSGSP